ncbi:nuclear transport factor 2 family protein [Clostridium estertheticum]|uniref:nuclear transport factor 2 family protein n=1 Tax=Clostridium estertheticum TaxID=238834 RepID=UPI00209B2104|nr:nuclear transport factor 2 family protein [Clostridium estertheticum]WAG67975.1 nuclear transport factor 2 family protein [Clostridium estertheticum]
MIKFSLSLVLVLLLVGCSTAKNETNLNDRKKMSSINISEDKQKIIAVYQQINDAMVDKDTKTLDNIFDDDYIFVHMSGHQQSKQEWFKQIENEEMRYFKIMPQKTTITIEGNTAILICDTKIDARIYGIRNTWRMRVEMNFEKCGYNWYPINPSK